MPKRVRAALLLSQLFAAAAFAQSAEAPHEFGRASGGEIELITKDSSRLSGTLGMSLSKSQLPFATGSTRTNRYEGNLGGTILDDRLWFFASAQQGDALVGSRIASLPDRGNSWNPAVSLIDSRLTAQIGTRHSLAASFAAGQQTVTAPGLFTAVPNNSSFLSLRYSGVVSDATFFNMSFTQRTAAQP